ncbi:MAG: inositol monophosphatase [Anaerohalosphaeraceae bacterium]|nr:inositol monophosphatase [Anaerohalosphaeraceae bacterium]
MEHKDLSAMLETAVVAARLAGQRAMEDISYTKASVKNGVELVTESDAKCQQIIIDKIKESFPDHGIIGEEGEDGATFKQPPRDDSDIWWVIDPIDGTNNFARGILNFAVSIAVMHKGQPVVGVVFEPSTDSMFTAVQDGPVQFNDRAIKTSDSDFGPFECVGIESIFADGFPDWVSQLMGKMRCRSIGTTALQLAYVAKGSFIATIARKPKIWDIAAGAFLAQSAGAIVTDWNGKDIFPVDLKNYNKESFEILTANKKTHPKLVEILTRK